MVVYLPGNRMLLMASEPTLKKMLAPNSGPRPLLDLLRKADMKSDIVVELMVAPLVKGASSAPGAAPSPGMGPAAMLSEIKTVSATVNLSGPMLLKATICGAKKDSADKLYGLISVFQTAITQQAQAAKSNPQGAPTAMAASMSAMGELLQGFNIAKQSDRVEISLKTPKNFPELAKQLAESAKGMASMGMPGAAPATPPPSQSPPTGK